MQWQDYHPIANAPAPGPDARPLERPARAQGVPPPPPELGKQRTAVIRIPSLETDADQRPTDYVTQVMAAALHCALAQGDDDFKIALDKRTIRKLDSKLNRRGDAVTITGPEALVSRLTREAAVKQLRKALKDADITVSLVQTTESRVFFTGVPNFGGDAEVLEALSVAIRTAINADPRVVLLRSPHNKRRNGCAIAYFASETDARRAIAAGEIRGTLRSRFGEIPFSAEGQVSKKKARPVAPPVQRAEHAGPRGGAAPAAAPAAAAPAAPAAAPPQAPQFARPPQGVWAGPAAAAPAAAPAVAPGAAAAYATREDLHAAIRAATEGTNKILEQMSRQYAMLIELIAGLGVQVPQKHRAVSPSKQRADRAMPAATEHTPEPATPALDAAPLRPTEKPQSPAKRRAKCPEPAAATERSVEPAPPMPDAAPPSPPRTTAAKARSAESGSPARAPSEIADPTPRAAPAAEEPLNPDATPAMQVDSRQ